MRNFSSSALLTFFLALHVNVHVAVSYVCLSDASDRLSFRGRIRQACINIVEA